MKYTRFFFTLGLLCSLASAFGQSPSVTWSDDIEGTPDELFRGPDGVIYSVDFIENIDGKDDDDEVILCRFDENMNLTSQKKILIHEIAPDYRFLKAIFWAGEVVLLARHIAESGENYIMSYLPLDPVSLEPGNEFYDIASLPGTGERSYSERRRHNLSRVQNITKDDFPTVVTSPNHLFVLGAIETKIKEKDILFLLGPDKKLIEMQTITHELEDVDGYYVHTDLKVTNSGFGVVYAGMISWKTWKKFSDKSDVLHMLSPENGYERVAVPAKDKMMIASLQYKTPDEIWLGGFYSSIPGHGEEAGLLLWQFTEASDPVFIPFSEEERNLLAPHRLLKMNCFFSRYTTPTLVPRTGNDWYLTMEEFHIVQRQDGFFYFETAQLIACSVNPETQTCQWMRVLPKIVRTTSYMRYVTSLSYQSSGNLVVLNNDTESNLRFTQERPGPPSRANIENILDKITPVWTVYTKEGNWTRIDINVQDEPHFVMDPTKCSILPDGTVLLLAQKIGLFQENSFVVGHMK